MGRRRVDAKVLQIRLKELFSYDPETGQFTRLVQAQGFRCEAGMIAGSLDKHGYINISVDGHKYKAHRLVWVCMYGRWPELEIDHKNRVRSDNRVNNLREATSEEQKWNTKLHSHNTTGIKGVSHDTVIGKYRASITHRNTFYHLGFFDTVEEAKRARLAGETKFRG